MICSFPLSWSFLLDVFFCFSFGGGNPFLLLKGEFFLQKLMEFRLVVALGIDTGLLKIVDACGGNKAFPLRNSWCCSSG